MKIIKEFIKEVIGFFFRFSGAPFLIREVFCRNKVTIVFYHNPKPEVFKRHIEYLSKHYNFISLERLVRAIHSKDWTCIPPKGLIVTIDDGHKENYKLLDIFKEYNIYPTIYLCSHIVNTMRKFWFRADFHNHHKLKKYDNKQRLKILRKKIGYEPQKEYSTRQALNLEELREMLPYVDFQSHSKFHPVLTTCSDNERKEEIQGSKDYLGKLLNKEIEHYSSPDGYYTDKDIEYIINFGYKSARTIDIGWNDINSNPFRLKTMGIQDDASFNKLCAQVSGFFGYIRYLQFGNFKGKQ